MFGFISAPCRQELGRSSSPAGLGSAGSCSTPGDVGTAGPAQPAWGQHKMPGIANPALASTPCPGQHILLLPSSGTTTQGFSSRSEEPRTSSGGKGGKGAVYGGGLCYSSRFFQVVTAPRCPAVWHPQCDMAVLGCSQHPEAKNALPAAGARAGGANPPAWPLRVALGV